MLVKHAKTVYVNSLALILAHTMVNMSANISYFKEKANCLNVRRAEYYFSR